MSERAMLKQKKKIYLKSIENKIPYNMIARSNYELEKYIEMTPAGKITHIQKKIDEAPAKDDVFEIE